ncbi:MAG: cell division protein FtsL [Anaerocolumna sp.]|nr:cell division protein FtsL [Anaerocolumna sp.]
MVVADNRAYDYNRHEYLEELQHEEKKLPKKSLKKKPKQRVNIMNIIFVFAVSIFLISRYAYIAEINFSNKQMDKQIKLAQTENTDLNVQLMKSVNLENLEKVAVDKLGMQYPDTMNQIIYVQVQQIEAEVAVSSDYHGVSDIQENKYLASVKGAIGSVLKVLD